MKRSLGWLLAAGLLGWTPAARAQADPAGRPAFLAPAYQNVLPPLDATGGEGNNSTAGANDDPFAVGTWTLQTVSGYFTRAKVGPHGPGFDYSPTGVRLGYIVDAYLGDNLLRGYTEILIEAHYSRVIRTFGTYIIGANAIFRYNFVQPDSLFVPYVQCGAGLAFNDAWQTPPDYQGLIGERMEFLLRAEGGLRMMITDDLSFDIEGGFQHISNAGLARHNGGVNMLGGGIGLTYFFGKPR